MRAAGFPPCSKDSCCSLGFVTAHRSPCRKRAARKRFTKAATHKQQYSEPGRSGNLYCCLPVALVEVAFLLLFVWISREKPQLNKTLSHEIGSLYRSMTWSTKTQNLPQSWRHRPNIFLYQTTRLSESLEGFNSSLVVADQNLPWEDKWFLSCNFFNFFKNWVFEP